MLQMERLINSTIEKHPNLSEVFSIYPAFRYRSLERDNSLRHSKINKKKQENHNKRLIKLIHDPEKIMKTEMLQKTEETTKISVFNIDDIDRRNIKSVIEKREQTRRQLSPIGIHFPKKKKEIARAATQVSQRKQLTQQILNTRKSQTRQIIFKLPHISEFRKCLKLKDKKQSANEQQINPSIQFKLIQAVQLNNPQHVLTPYHERYKKFSLDQSTFERQQKNKKRQYICGWTVKQFE